MTAPARVIHARANEPSSHATTHAHVRTFTQTIMNDKEAKPEEAKPKDAKPKDAKVKSKIILQRVRVVGMRHREAGERKEEWRLGSYLDCRRQESSAGVGVGVAVYIQPSNLHLAWIAKEQAVVLVPLMDAGKVKILSAQVMKVEKTRLLVDLELEYDLSKTSADDVQRCTNELNAASPCF